MTGIVVVSHSRVLADAAVALASEMLHGSPARITVAAGLDARTFGTDAAAIVDAIAAADDADGVVVLMDLGSAVLSAEMALDLIDPALRDRVVLCAAPLVEGLVVAAVAAAGGAKPAEVAAEAMGALAAKQSHLGPPPQDQPDAGDAESVEPTALTASFEVTIAHGLHARPAARLVQEARLFDATVRLRNLTTGTGPVPATSLSRVATLGALLGHRVEVSASGSQAREALEHVVALAGRGFDEADRGEPAPLGEPSAAASDKPMPAAPGIAVGPVIRRRVAEVEIPDQPAGDPAAEWRRVREAVALTRREIQQIRARAARDVGEDEARIFDAHLMLVDDAHLLDDVRERVGAGSAAPRAWLDAVADVERELAAVDDAYIRARAADVRAVGQQVARALVGATAVQVDGDGVLVADDLAPAEVADLDPARVRGIVLASGSPTGHSAILARSRGIPTVVAAGAAVLAVPAGATIAIDGGTGEVVVDPSPQVVAELSARAARARARAADALAAAHLPASTVDGTVVAVGANLGSRDDAVAAAAAGADVAGLVRTEFLFLGRDTPPSVDEQVAAYRELADAMGGRRVTLRTLDVGGDKPLAYAPQPHEANPFLGVRGIRFGLAQHDLLRDQLTAVARVARQTPVSVMFPMVSTVEEYAEARRRLGEALDSVGGPPADLKVGVMVEVPALAMKAAAFAADVDFFSIGTNDLTQYALAAERGNAALATVADPLDPGVLRMVDAVCRAADGQAAVAVCGELAADDLAAALLVALGVRQLSVAPAAVPGVKQAVRSLTSAANPTLVGRCLAAPGPAEVRAVLAAEGSAT